MGFNDMVICANIYVDHDMISYCAINDLHQNNSLIENSDSRLIYLCDSIGLFNEGKELFPDFEIPENLNSSNIDIDDKKSIICKNISLDQITNYSNDFKNIQHKISECYKYNFDFAQQMKEMNADNNKNCNAITISTPYISKIDNGVFLTQKTSNNNYNLSHFLHDKNHKHSEFMSAFTNNL
ncbi:hypothetical protein COBT_003386, partial [Conglomerata obtusa]